MSFPSSNTSCHSSPQNPSQRRTPKSSTKYMTSPPGLYHNITPNTPPTTAVPTNAVHPPSFLVSSPQIPTYQLDQTPTPSLDQPDDESINSTNSNNNMSLVIKPCTTYSKYGLWLKQQFPQKINQRKDFFVHSILKIRTLDDVQVFHDYTPLEWKEHLDKSYHVWMKTIIELIIIWTVTLDIYDEVPFSQYLEVRNEMLPILYPMYEEHVCLLLHLLTHLFHQLLRNTMRKWLKL